MIEKIHNGVRYFVRFIHERDIPMMVKIETSQDYCCAEEELRKIKRKRDVIGMVVEVADKANRLKLIGFAFYRLHENYNQLIRFVIHHEYRRQGWGRLLMEGLFARLSSQRRNCLVVHVRETDLDAQLFLRAMGFKAVKVLREYFKDTKEAAYKMEYWLDGEATGVAAVAEVDDDFDVYLNEGAD
jgi:ribosomal-protein-alanine N-acetyltransferase